MRIRRLCAAMLAVVILLCSNRPVPARAAGAVPAQLMTLPNGLRVVVLEDHAAPVVQVATWYRFGGAYETPGKTGLAHGLEHMMFRGTPSLSSSGLDDLGARLGAQFNAGTTNEYTKFYFVVPADRADVMIHVEADRMVNLKLTQKDWDIEKQAVLQEWDQDHSSPTATFIQDVGAKMYPGPLGKNALGVRDDIVKSTAADLRKYYSEYYRPNNATLVVTGDVKAADIFASAKRWFGPLAAGHIPAAHIVAPAPANNETVAASAEFPFELVDLAYALPPDSPQTEVTLSAAEFAMTAFQNARAPMRHALIDSGITIFYGMIPQTDRHVSTAHVLLIVAPGHTADDARAAFEKSLAESLASGITPEYIEAARRSAIANLTYSRDSITGLGDGIGSGYVFPGDTDPGKAESILNGITVDQVNAAAKSVFAKPNVVGILKPTTTDPTKARAPGNIAGISDNFSGRVPNGPIVQAAWVKASIARPLALVSRVKPTAFTLPNGLKLLVQEVHANPTILIEGNVRGSNQFDPPGKEGLGSMTSSLLNYGGTKYDFATQRRISDDLAAQINFGQRFSARGFARNTDTLINVLADDIEHPALTDERLTLLRTQSVAATSRRDAQPQYRSARAFLEALYPPGDPALREESVDSLKSLTDADVKAYAAQYYRPDLTTLVVTGDVDTEDIHQKILAAFGPWSVAGPKPDAHLPAIPLPAPVRKLVETPAIDYQVELGTTAMTRTNPDFDTFRLMNSLLGNGGFDSRLMEEVRQKRGLVYNISSDVNAGTDRGTMTISFRAIPSKADQALAVIKQQMRRLQTEPVSPTELDRQKIRLAASAVIAEQSTFAIAGDLMNIGTNDLPLDYYATYAARFAKITPADIQRVAKTYLHPDNLVEVRTGPKT